MLLLGAELGVLISPEYEAKINMEAAYEGKSVKQWLMDLARVRLAEMEKRGMLPKGKG